MPNVANEAKAAQKMGIGTALIIVVLAGTLAAGALGIWGAVAVWAFRLVAGWLQISL